MEHGIDLLRLDPLSTLELGVAQAIHWLKLWPDAGSAD